MQPPSAHGTISWFRTGEGRRYGRDIAIIVALKLVLLTVLYVFCIAPQPRPDASADAMRRHVLDATPTSPTVNP